MSTATSIVGTWNIFIDWGCDGGGAQAGAWTFKSDGSWTYQFGEGRWIQVEGMVAWNFSNAAGLIFTANVTRNALVGIMGYAISGSSPGTGCFYALRQQVTTAAAAPSPKDHDIAIGPPKK